MSRTRPGLARPAGPLARVAAGALLVAAVAGADPATGPAPERAADFTARTVEGHRLTLAGLLERGPVVLDFWATWCRPCERSLPALQKLHAAYAGSGVSVVAVSVDGPRNWARVRPFAVSRGLTFAIVIDEDGSLARRYQVAAVPTSLVIAPSGEVVRRRSGWAAGDEGTFEAAIRTALAGTAADTAR